MQIPFITYLSNFSSGSLRKSFYFHFLDERLLKWALHPHSRTTLGQGPTQVQAGQRRKAYDGGQSSATSTIYSLHWHALLHFQQDPETHLVPSSSKEAAGKSSWIEDRAEHIIELVCLFLLFPVLSANYYLVLTASQPHLKDATWQGNRQEKAWGGDSKELTGLGTK